MCPQSFPVPSTAVSHIISLCTTLARKKGSQIDFSQKNTDIFIWFAITNILSLGCDRVNSRPIEADGNPSLDFSADRISAQIFACLEN